MGQFVQFAIPAQGLVELQPHLQVEHFKESHQLRAFGHLDKSLHVAQEGHRRLHLLLRRRRRLRLVAAELREFAILRRKLCVDPLELLLHCGGDFRVFCQRHVPPGGVTLLFQSLDLGTHPLLVLSSLVRLGFRCRQLQQFPPEIFQSSLASHRGQEFPEDHAQKVIGGDGVVVTGSGVLMIQATHVFLFAAPSHPVHRIPARHVIDPASQNVSVRIGRSCLAPLVLPPLGVEFLDRGEFGRVTKGGVAGTGADMQFLLIHDGLCHVLDVPVGDLQQPRTVGPDPAMRPFAPDAPYKVANDCFVLAETFDGVVWPWSLNDMGYAVVFPHTAGIRRGNPFLCEQVRDPLIPPPFLPQSEDAQPDADLLLVRGLDSDMAAWHPHLFAIGKFSDRLLVGSDQHPDKTVGRATTGPEPLPCE